MLNSILINLKKFREFLFTNICYRADATIELIDALATNTTADSVVKLSLNPSFKRSYNSIHDALTNFHKGGETQRIAIQQAVAKQSQLSSNRPFYLLGIDCTPAPRQFAKTLADRSYVYSPNAVAGNKPVTIGHCYSLIASLPEKTGNKTPPWILPIAIKRVTTETEDLSVGIQQLAEIIEDPNLPFKKNLTVSVQDSKYSAPKFIYAQQKHDNLVTITRLRSNRIINYSPPPKTERYLHSRGHELWYGKEFDFKDATTWRKADAEAEVHFVSKRGKQYKQQIKAWNDMLMRQKNGIALQEYPFTLVCITTTDLQGKEIFKKPLWLMVSGKRRQELSLQQIYGSYKQRFDLEHFFRFGKNRLLINKYQTTEVQHEENWWSLAILAYTQLYMARSIVGNLPHPWEKYLPSMQTNNTIKSPTQVQRSFERITLQIGTPACAPKPRGNPLGRPKGYSPGRKKRFPMVIKGRKQEKLLAA